MVVVNQAYCVPGHLEMQVRRKKEKLTDGDFVITGVNGNLLFKPLGGLTKDMMFLLDGSGSGSPILTLIKIDSFLGSWKVFRGVSTEESDLVYTVNNSVVFNFKTKVDVFLSHNKEHKRCDFRVKGTWLKRACTLYAGDDTDIVVAEFQKKKKVEKKVDNFSVIVYPYIDSAFMASLTIILDDLIRQDRTHAEKSARVFIEALNNITQGLMGKGR